MLFYVYFNYIICFYIILKPECTTQEQLTEKITLQCPSKASTITRIKVHFGDTMGVLKGMFLNRTARVKNCYFIPSFALHPITHILCPKLNLPLMTMDL